MPTHGNKQYKSVQKVREAVQVHGASLRPQITQNEPDHRSFYSWGGTSHRYGLRFTKDGETKLSLPGISLELLNQCLGAYASTIEHKQSKKG